jgi:hypothetical protein
VARAIHASNRSDLGTRIENAGKCGLDESGKQPVNESDEEIFEGGSFRDEHNVMTRHGRACPGHPRLHFNSVAKTWMPGTSPGMTKS